MPENNDDEMSRLAIQAQLAQQQGQTIQAQIDMLQNTITDLNVTLDTLRNLKKAKTESLLPIGSGAYITCQKVETDNVLLAVGSGIIVTKKVDEAVDALQKRLQTIGEAYDKAQKDLLDINDRLSALNSRAMALSGQMENVRPA